MPASYLDENGLEHVVAKAKETFANKKELWNWQKTEKAGAVAFTPVPDSVLEPVVEFKFKETLPAEGEKGPENPSTIEGVSSIQITQTNKNLASQPYHTPSCVRHGITWTINADGSVTANGTATANSVFYVCGIESTNLKLPVGTKCFLSGCPSGGSYSSYFMRCSSGTGNTYLSANDIGSGTVCTINDSNTTVGVMIQITEGYTANNLTFYPQLEFGETKTSLEPFTRSRNIIEFSSTYYGGSLDINTGILTVTHDSYTLTGNESWYLDTELSTSTVNCFRCTPDIPHVMGTPNNKTTRWCSHFDFVFGTGVVGFQTWEQTPRIVLHLPSATYPDASSVNAWLASEQSAGHPVVIVYAVNEPYTVQLDPTQIKSLASIDKYEPRINTIYTDAESIQVGYQKFTAEGNFVHVSGKETIDGEKTFDGFIQRDGEESTRVSGLILRNKSFTKGEIPQQSLQHIIAFCDSNNPEYSTNTSVCHGRAAVLQTVINSTDNGISLQNVVYKNSAEPYESYYNSVRTSVGFDANEIPYATAPETSDERTNSSDIVTRDWAYSKMWNWQKTKKEQYVQFYPASDSSLEPIVNFTFIETPPTEGEKSIDNPSTIAGVNEIKITRCGKSVRNIDIIGGERYGITCIDNGDGSYTLNGIANHDVGFGIPNMITLYPGTYTLSGCPSGGSVSTYFLAGLSGRYDTGNGKTFVINETQDFSVWIQILSGTDISTPITFRPQLELGSAVTSFEPYEGNDYTVQLGNTYYGGSLNLATGVLTATHYAYAFTGAETGWWERTEMTNVVRYGLYGESWSSVVRATKNHHTPICSHFTLNYDYYADQPHFYVGDTGNQYYFYPDPTLSRDDWKAWLAEQYAAGHPLTVCFELAEPIVVQLTSMQIKSLSSTDKYSPQINTIYTDAESVEVGYQRFVDDENAVHRTGDESVEGYKIFSNSHVTDSNESNAVVSSLGMKNDALIKGIVPEDTRRISIQMLDSTGNDMDHIGRLASLEYESPSTSKPSYRTYMRCWQFLPGDSPSVKKGMELSLGYDDNGNGYASAPQTSNDRNEPGDILTRSWRISEEEIDDLSI